MPVSYTHLDVYKRQVSTGQQVQHSQPDVVTGHNDDDDLQEGGQLMGDGALVAPVSYTHLFPAPSQDVKTW